MYVPDVDHMIYDVYDVYHMIYDVYVSLCHVTYRL